MNTESFIDKWDGSTTEETVNYGNMIELLRCNDTHILVVFKDNLSFGKLGTYLIRSLVERNMFDVVSTSVRFDTKENVRYIMAEFISKEAANKYSAFVKLVYQANIENSQEI